MPEEITIRGLFPTLAAIGGIFALMWVVLWLSTRALERVARRMGDEDQIHLDEINHWAKQLIRFMRRIIEAIAGLAALALLLRGFGVRSVRRLDWEQVVEWLTGPGVRIVFVLGGAYVLARVAHLLIARLPGLLLTPEGTAAEMAERQKRAATITRLLNLLTTVVVMGIAALIVLGELGVNIAPILTGAGIAGLAVGFGAQNLVRDIITGVFLILEDQVRVGDVAFINGKGGLVEDIRLRTIRLRDFDGTVHYIPNGAINELSNCTKDFSYYVIDLGVAYKENVDRVMGVLKDVGRELEKDPAYKERILAPLEVVGVDALGNSAVVLKMRIKTVPRQQWTVGRELQRRIKNAFDAQGIEIPFPHLSVYFGEASKPFTVQLRDQSGPDRVK